MNTRKAFAIAAHPDDIEFMMAGTLMLLGDAGYEIHYMNVADGSCGSMTMDAKTTAATRLDEARNAAKSMSAIFHAPITPDLMVYYTPQLVAKLCAIIREVGPEILLLPAPDDYMEDHTNTSRLGVTAAFCRNMPNFQTDPASKHIESEMAVYHALPYGLCDQLRNTVHPHFYVDVESVLQAKADALAKHVSQKQWLDDSQGQDSYITTLKALTAATGKMSGRCKYAEGWRRHSHLGFGPEDFDPLCKTLAAKIFKEK